MKARRALLGGPLDEPEKRFLATHDASRARLALEGLDAVLIPRLDALDTEAITAQAQSALTAEWSLQWAARRIALLQIRRDLESLIAKDPGPGGLTSAQDER